MATYAKRTCSECGLREEQPHMHHIEVSPIGVNGNTLAPRMKWFCESCARPHFWNQQWKERLRREEEMRLNHDAIVYKAKKAAWAAEQERRRQANLLKRANETLPEQ